MTNAARRPLVVIDGLVCQLPAGDSLDAVVSEVDATLLTNGTATAIVICTPVYISAANSFSPARANAPATIGVFGLVRTASVAAGASGTVQTDGFMTASTAQWDAVTGETGGLIAGATYYLSASTAGRLTRTAPTATGEYVIPVGRAISTQSFEISPGMPIRL